MNDQIFIQHRFSVERGGQTLQDAIVLPKEDYEKLSPEEIEAQKEERFTNWQIAINTPQEVVEPTKEDLEAQQVSIDQQIESLQSQKVELSSKLEQVMLSESLEAVVVK